MIYHHDDNTRRYPRSIREAFGRPNDGVVEHFSAPATASKAVKALGVALAIAALVFVAVWLGRALGDDPQESLSEVTESLQQAQRKEAAMREMCGGENAVAVELPGGDFQCRTKRNHVTKTVKNSN